MTPDEIEAFALANVVSWWSSVARARGGSVLTTPDLVAIDGLGPNPVVNRCVLLRPDLDPATVVATVRDVYGGKPAGPFSIWDPWAALDLTTLGLRDPVELPHMAWEVDERTAPTQVRDAHAHELAAAQSLVEGAFDFVPWDGSTVYTPGLFGERSRLLVVEHKGAPAATAIAHDAGGVTGVYLVATRKDARGLGLGEAVSWAATLAFPGQPAVLQASRMGFPVYERMGYRTFRTIKVWFADRPS